MAIVAASQRTAQLRWFLVDPAARLQGLGKRLLGEAISFSREQGYAAIVLWTVGALVAAAHLYQADGFRKATERTAQAWSVDVVEEMYELALR